YISSSCISISKKTNNPIQKWAFKDISKYFPKKEWADLGYSEKITYVYMKRNYDIMTDLDEPAQEASNMQERKHLKQSKKTSGPKGRKINVWTHRLRERKNVVIYEEISDPKEDD
uniref:KRAB-related domain-containing protein n=1 Tax=Balaenoptera musculus TaxID=9771 RepID=A0A8C0HYN3_BALMU